MDNSVTFSKIVATPTLNSWSQAYNAGKLFAVLSIEKTANQDQDADSLNLLGKSLLDKLEQEFFTLEVKDLESIKKSVLQTFENTTEGIIASFSLGFFNGNALYLFILGKGKIFIKRGDKLGNILTSSDDDLKKIVSSSGFVQNNDLIVLETSAFSDIVSPDVLSSSLETGTPTDATETLAPKIHETEDGRASAIIIKYNEPQNETQAIIAEEKEEENMDSIITHQKANMLDSFKKTITLFSGKAFSLFQSKLKPQNFKSNPKKKIFFITAVTIAVILVFSIITAVNNQNNAKIASLFSEVFPQAQKKYDEGESLLDLNKNLAKDSFLTAQKILEENKSKFPEKSKEKEQIDALLKNVNDKLTSITSSDKVSEDRTKLSVSVKNGSGVTGAASKASDLLKGLRYNVVSSGNADKDDYKNTKIQVKNSKKEFLDILKNDLSKNYTIGETSSDLPADSSEDALITIGR